jgi:hypothetical protein
MGRRRDHEALRERLLARLIQRHAISEDLARKLLAWRHLGLSPPQQEKPPPTREVVRVPLDDEGRDIQVG